METPMIAQYGLFAPAPHRNHAISTTSQIVLRSTQPLAIEMARKEIKEGKNRVIICAPCGFGKSVVAAKYIELARAKGSKVWFIVDRQNLVSQMSKHLESFGISHGVMMAGHAKWNPQNTVQVASIQTVERRGWQDDIDLLLTDEAHSMMRKSFISFAEKHPEKRILGFTATPFHANIGQVYDAVVSPTTVNKQIEEGHLVPLRIFQCIEADMRGAKIVAGEWSDDDVQERGSKIVGDIVSTWIKMTMQLFGQPVKTIVFSSTIAHGQEIADQFAAAGYNFKVVSCRDKSEEKTDTIADFKLSESEYDGLISCGVLTRGFDVTDIQIAIMARPFRKAFSEFIQQVGRVQRSHTWPDGTKKEFGVLLDHASNVARFRDEMLDLFENGVTSLADPPDAKPPRKEPTKTEKDQMFCPKCKILWAGGDTCSCGFKIKKKVSLIENVPGQIVEMDMTGRKANKTTSKSEKQQFYSELIGYGQSKGFAPGWSAHQYREKFGVWPNSMLPVPAQPTTLVTGYLHHQRIKKAKSNQA